MATYKHMLNAQISEEAAEWFVEFRMGKLDFGARQAFDAWVRTSPEHLRAYLELAAIWNEAPALGGAAAYDASVLQTRAANEDNVVALGEQKPAGMAGRARRMMFGRRALLAAGVAAAAIGAWGWAQFLRGPVYSTDIAELRSVALEDGTKIDLNARSKIRVSFDEGERTVTLIEGQALFDVAKDPYRPFVVRSGKLRVHVVGTQFDINRRRSGTVVSVVEGRVALFSPAMGVDGFPTARSILSAGEQALVERNGLIDREDKPNVLAATAWTRRQLAFESARLEDIAEEFNRYSPRRFVVEGEGLADLRLSGMFSPTDLEFLLRFLNKRPGIGVVETEREVRIVRRD